jgi:phage FluMu protein Com
MSFTTNTATANSYYTYARPFGKTYNDVQCPACKALFKVTMVSECTAQHHHAIRIAKEYRDIEYSWIVPKDSSRFEYCRFRSPVVCPLCQYEWDVIHTHGMIV